MPLDLTKKGLARHKQRRAVAAVRNDVDRAIRVMTIGYLDAQEEKRFALNQRIASISNSPHAVPETDSGLTDNSIAPLFPEGVDVAQEQVDSAGISAANMKEVSSNLNQKEVGIKSISSPSSSSTPSSSHTSSTASTSAVSNSIHLASSQEAITSAEAALAATLRFAAAVGTKASKRTEELMRRAITQQRVLSDAEGFVESIESECGRSWESQLTDHSHFQQHSHSHYEQEAQNLYQQQHHQQNIHDPKSNKLKIKSPEDTRFVPISLDIQSTPHSPSALSYRAVDERAPSLQPPLLQRAVTDINNAPIQHQQEHYQQKESHSQHPQHTQQLAQNQKEQQKPTYHSLSYDSMGSESFDAHPQPADCEIHAAITQQMANQQEASELFASTESLSFANDNNGIHDNVPTRHHQRSATATLPPHPRVYPRPILTPVPIQEDERLEEFHQQLPSASERSIAQKGRAVELPNQHTKLLKIESGDSHEEFMGEKIDATEEKTSGQHQSPLLLDDENPQFVLMAQRYTSATGERYIEPKRDYSHSDWQRRHVKSLETLAKSGLSQAELLVQQVRSAASALSPHSQISGQASYEDISALSIDPSTISDALSRLPPLDARSPVGVGVKVPSSSGTPKAIRNVSSPTSSRSGNSICSPLPSDARASLRQCNSNSGSQIGHMSLDNQQVSLTGSPLPNPVTSLSSSSSAFSTSAANVSMTSTGRSQRPPRFSPETVRSITPSTSTSNAIAALACAVGVRGLNPNAALHISASPTSLSSLNSCNSSLTNLQYTAMNRSSAGFVMKPANAVNGGALGQSPIPSPVTPFTRGNLSTNSMGSPDGNFDSMRAALSATSITLQGQTFDDPERIALLAASNSQATNRSIVSSSNTTASQNSGGSSSITTGPVKFQRLGKIGQGAVGEVYRCSLSENGMNVAVKEAPVSDKKNCDRVIREAKIMRELIHPNIICFFGLHTTDESAKILMEHAAGGSVHQRLVEAGPIQHNLIRSISLGVLDALTFMHSKGLVHLDVKCQNILLTAEGQVKLADFGATCWVHPTYEEDGEHREYPLDETLKRIKAAASTPVHEDNKKCDHFTVKWTAPEVLRGEPVTNVADVWSLGCAIVEMVNGRSPWYQESFKTDAEARNYIALEDKIPEFAEGKLHPFAVDFIKQCLTRNPEARPTTAQLLRHPWVTSDASIFVETATTATLEASLANKTTSTSSNPRDGNNGKKSKEEDKPEENDDLGDPMYYGVPAAFEEEDNPQFNKFLARSKQAAEQRPFRHTSFSPGGGAQSVTAGLNTHTSPTNLILSAGGYGGQGSQVGSPSQATTTLQSAGLTSAGLVHVPGSNSMLVSAVIGSSPQGSYFPASPPLTPFQPKFELGMAAGLVHARLPNSQENMHLIASRNSRLEAARIEASMPPIEPESKNQVLQLPVFSSTPATSAQHVGTHIGSLPPHATILTGVTLSPATISTHPRYNGEKNSAMGSITDMVQGVDLNSAFVESSNNSSQLELASSNMIPASIRKVEIRHNDKSLLGSSQPVDTSDSAPETDYPHILSVNEGLFSLPNVETSYNHTPDIKSASADQSPAGVVSPGTSHTQSTGLALVGVGTPVGLGGVGGAGGTGGVGGGARLISTIAEENSQRSSASSLHSSAYSSLDPGVWASPSPLSNAHPVVKPPQLPRTDESPPLRGSSASLFVARINEGSVSPQAAKDADGGAGPRHISTSFRDSTVIETIAPDSGQPRDEAESAEKGPKRMGKRAQSFRQHR